MSLPTFQPGVGYPSDEAFNFFYRPISDVFWALWYYTPAEQGWTISSWFRDPGRNAASGGAQGSQHLIATAVDLLHPWGERAYATVEPYFRRLGFYTARDYPGGRAHLHVQRWIGRGPEHTAWLSAWYQANGVAFNGFGWDDGTTVV